MENKSVEEIINSDKTFLGTTEAAALLGIAPCTLRRNIDDYAKRFPVERVGKKLRIPKAPLVAYIRTGKYYEE